MNTHRDKFIYMQTYHQVYLDFLPMLWQAAWPSTLPSLLNLTARATIQPSAIRHNNIINTTCASLYKINPTLEKFQHSI